MIETCQKCGGLYATGQYEMFAGTPCKCPLPHPKAQPPPEVSWSAWLSEKEAFLDLLRLVYDEHMHFGWGYEECHDRVYQMLLKYGRLPQQEIDASFADNVRHEPRRD